MSAWRPYEPCLENEVRASFARFVIEAWPEDAVPPNPVLLQIVSDAAVRFDERPLYRASCEVRAELRANELRGHKADRFIIDEVKET